ncbi:MAG TPA: hypothetical protein VIZ17_00100 [Acetobacteraceae bacterium]
MVAVVNDAQHGARAAGAADVVLAPQVLGGEPLAMALLSEAVESEMPMQRLLHVST